MKYSKGNEGEQMVAAMILRDNRVEIAAGKSYSSPAKKRLSLAVGNGFIRSGKIISPHFLGKLLTDELKKYRIFPRELYIAVRSNDIIIENIQISNCEKACVLQRAKEVLETGQPGMLEKNYITCRRCEEVDGGFCLNVAIAPKILIEQYHALAAAMKCRIGKLAIYGDCMGKLELKESMPLERERIFVEIGGDFVQFYCFGGGELQRIYGFVTQQIPFHFSEDKLRKELLDKICQDIQALPCRQAKEGDIYINNAGYLEEAEIKYLKKQLGASAEVRYVFMQDLDRDLDGSLLNTFFSDKKKGEGLIAISEDRRKKHTTTGRSAGLLTAAAAGAFAAAMSFGFFWYVSAGQLQQKLEEDEAYLYANESVRSIYLEHERLKEEKLYVEKLDARLNTVDTDYRPVLNRIEEIAEQGESRLNRVALTSDLELQIEGSAAGYSDVNTIMEKMEKAGMEKIELLKVQTAEEQDKPIIYAISAVYTIERD
ncbi:MAG: hypothetical protein LIP16_10765 [Clostridium sp.]|nr:hypothetical protein [Clostridium sp.]